jgi:hypothetical protein
MLLNCQIQFLALRLMIEFRHISVLALQLRMIDYMLDGVI